MDANNVVLLLNELEDRGHIARRRDPTDRGRHRVELTPAGRRALMGAERAQEASRTRCSAPSTQTNAPPCGDC
jgi:DNA-binding MarR family transcriptional regulator